MHIWDIVQELIPLAFATPIHNPFELNRLPPNTAPLFDVCLAYGALAQFLRKVYLTNSPFAESRMFFLFAFTFQKITLDQYTGIFNGLSTNTSVVYRLHPNKKLYFYKCVLMNHLECIQSMLYLQVD